MNRCLPACAQGITHLLFSGITTDVCVHTTLREAAIHMVMVEDRIFGTIATADAAIAGLSAGDASYSKLRET